MSDQAESDVIERVRVVLRDYARGARGAVSALISIDALAMDDEPCIPPEEHRPGGPR